MADLQKYNARICLTAVAVCINNHQVLLVKHKKLRLWLAPGGHVEAGELPHHAAEREFFEETGLKAEAINMGFDHRYKAQEDEYVPNPILSNLHWISHENYHSRLKDPKNYHPQAPWSRGCEQHLALVYLVKLQDRAENFQHDPKESDDIGWISPKQLDHISTTPSIRSELKYAFNLVDSHSS